LRYDHLRRVLVVVVAGLLFLPAALFSQKQNPSQVRSVRLSLVSGKVTIKRPGATEGVQAQVNTAIEEGFVVSTSAGSFANVQLENGSTIRLSEHAKADFTQLNTDADGNKLNVITLERGLASFYFIPERQDVSKVKVADATLTSHGKTEFETNFTPGTVQLRVLAGSITISAHASSLTLGKGKTMVYNPLTAAEAGATSHARVVRLSYVSGTVMVKRPGSAEEEPAMVNVPIQEGFELSTSDDSHAEVEFENGSTARLGELSKLLFDQLALDADGNKLNGMTFEQGYATFHFLPEHNVSRSAKRDGNIHFQPTYSDVYRVKIADATVTADGKCEFRTDLEQDSFRVEVFNGSVDVATSTLSSKLGEGKILEHKSSGAELAFNTQKGIVKDTWDQWTEARDKQVQLTGRDEPIHPTGPRYGWSELDTYGEWIALPGGRFGWSPYARAGWSPYTYGRWEWYPGLGWTWISGEPWGWLPYHCGLWDYDASFGWYWMNPMFGCGLWGASLVNWYSGPGWMGWAPKAGPGHPGPHPPGPGHPGPVPVLGHFPRGIVTVPTSVVQNRQLITPQTVSHIPLTVANMIEHPPFEPGPRPTSAAGSPAPGTATTSKGNTTTATAPPAPAPISGGGAGLASHHASAPSTILMGGDAAKESALLADQHFHSGRDPLRATEGTTLGGRYPVGGSTGEFRGKAFGGGENKGSANGKNGPLVGPAVSYRGGGSGAIIMAHGQGGGGSRGGGYSGGGGGGSSSGGARSGGGGGSVSGGGGAAHSSGGGGTVSGGGGGGGGAGHH
jgi:ferric-dicitrate binding protein FerR (iron transport regulator)